jgi:hypothetical protein
MLSSAYLSRKLTSPIPTKDGGTLRTIGEACEYMAAIGKEREHQSVRDEKQRYDESWNEEGGAQLTRQEAGLVALVEGLEQVCRSPDIEHPNEGKFRSTF